MSETWTPAEAEQVIVALGGGMDQIDGVQLTVARARALAARLAEVEGQARLSNARAMELEAERDEARRRLAEVEAERDRLDVERDEHLDRAAAHRKVIALQGIERDETEAERDRLAQELEDALGHLRAVLDAWDAMAENYEMGPFFEAREFLARFPREGDEG